MSAPVPPAGLHPAGDSWAAVKQEDEEARSSGTTATIGRQGPIQVLSSPFGAAPAAALPCSSPSGSMASSKESSLKETLRQQGPPLGAAAGSAGLTPPPPLLQGREDLQQQRQMWRPAIPLGKAASLTRAMSISRSGSARQALPAAAVLGQASAAGSMDTLAGTVATPPPLSAAAAAAAAAALASATTSSGGSGSAPLGRRKKLGRPIAFQGDINSQELTESERRHIRRRELNRASARRVRAKASATLGELASRMAQLEQHNSALAAQVASVESDRSALQQQVVNMGQQLQAAAEETQRLRFAQASAQQQLQEQQQQQQQQHCTQQSQAAEDVASANAKSEQECKRAQCAANREIDEYKERINKRINDIKAEAEVKEAALQKRLVAISTEWQEQVDKLEAEHQAALTALQDSSTAEKDPLQMQAVQLRDLAEERLKSMETAQADARGDKETLNGKITALNDDLTAAKASHEEEVARLHSEAEAALAKALKDAEEKHNHHLANTITELDAANRINAKLDKDMQDLEAELLERKDQVQALERELHQTNVNLAEKEQRLARIGQQAFAASPSERKRASPPGSQQNQLPPNYVATEVVEEAQEEVEYEMEQLPRKRQGRHTPSRFHQATREQHRHLMRQQTQYECGEESQEEEDAYSDGAEDQVPEQRGRGRCVFTEPPLMGTQRQQHASVGRGRKTMFATMSAHTATDLEDEEGGQQNSYRRRGAGNGSWRGGGSAPAATLMKTKKGGTDKKRKAAQGGPPGTKRGPSSAMNLFGNTDPYAFAAGKSPA